MKKKQLLRYFNRKPVLKQIHAWQCSMKRVQQEEIATQKSSMKISKHENSATQEKSNVERV